MKRNRIWSRVEVTTSEPVCEANDRCNKESPGTLIPKKESTQRQKSAFHNNSLDYEASQQRFRQFCYQEVAGPHEDFSTLWEPCWQWVRPKTHSKEKILEPLILEQFLTTLLEELQTWVKKQCPENEEAVALVENVQRVPGQQVRKGNQNLVVLIIRSWVEKHRYLLTRGAYLRNV